MENLKIRVANEQESKEAQELLFELGGKPHGDVTDRCGLVIFANGTVYVDHDYFENHYTKSYDAKEITLPELRAMVEPKMKEYLMPFEGGYNYILTDAREGLEPHAKDWIEIPEGSEFAVLNGDNEINFYAGFGLEKSHFIPEFIVWQREQDEPFLTPETTLNDQYAEIEEVRQALKDNVNHPSHYADSAIECIDAMEAMMTPEQFIGYLRGNLFKYQWRYEKKNGIEDLKKAQWYLEKLTVKIAEKNAPF